MSTAQTARPAQVLFSRTAVVASCLGFVLIGALQALYGPSIPALRTRFGLSESGAGLGLGAHFVGGVSGVLIFDRLHGRVGNRTVLGASYALMAVGGLGFALAPTWPLALVAALVTGLGFGGIDYGLNQLFAVGFGPRSTAMLNLLNAHFGVGAIAGPALIGVFGGDRHPAVFAALAALSAGLVLTVRGVRDDRPEPAAPQGAAPATGRRATAVLAVFVLLYVLHVGVESAIGGWEPTHLEAVGHQSEIAVAATSGYWLMMTVGRFLVAPLVSRWSAPVVVTAGCAGMTACLALAPVSALAPYAYAGAGLFIAPIFPTGLPWLNQAAPRASRAGAWVIAASMAGGVAATPALGTAIDHLGITAVPVLLTALSALCLAAACWLTHATRIRPDTAVA
ncbi:MFS transporter [Kitasatospora sp. NPDC087861]|uniref:MFS transporter n=1 Tax=Kitasatospora sp. NPDC087861 TaxID=3364070 RepID=UPI00380531A0